VKDATAVALAAGRVRRGNITGALQLLTRQAAYLICRYCAGAGDRRLADGGLPGTSHAHRHRGVRVRSR
jgi:hypothetical protein